MTPFVESFATQQLLPPWEAKGVRTWSFAIRLAEARVRGYLAKYFNGAYPDHAPFHYEPLPGAQFALLSVSHYPNIASLNRSVGMDPVSGGHAWDRISYNEVSLAIPVRRYRVTPDRLLTEPALVWVQPVVYADNDTIVFSSREIWGTDMFLATIETDAGLPANQVHLDAGLTGIRRFDPRSVDERLACLHIRASGASDRDLPAILKAQPDLQAFVEIVGASGVFADRQRPRGVKGTPTVDGVELNNLKQFRDCYDMGAAIYRAIVASRTSYTRVADIVLYDTGKVEIAFMWSDSLAEVLRTILDASGPTAPGPPAAHADDWSAGLNWDMDRVVVEAQLGFAYTADVRFDVLGTIHTYGTPA